MLAGGLPPLDGRTIVCTQAGNVNTGAFDPAAEICLAARKAGSWVHVDGAFGLFAALSPQYRHLTAPFVEADSWAADAHKWPIAGYDCGLAFVRDSQKNSSTLRPAMVKAAAFISCGAFPAIDVAVGQNRS